MQSAAKEMELVVAYSLRNRGIGKDGGMPWPRLKADLVHFKELTTGVSEKGLRNAVIMGRKTWDSLPTQVRPLPGRLNVVLSRRGVPNLPSIVDAVAGSNAVVASELNEALEALSTMSNIEKVFITGGESIYREALKREECKVLHVTEIFQEYDCDVVFPAVEQDEFEKQHVGPVQVQGDVAFQMVEYKRVGSPRAVDHEEHQYLDLIRDILENGKDKPDRTGTGVRSVFGRQMRFNLENGVFPLLTTKRVYWKGVAEELLWFIAGCTNAKTLSAKKVRIWDGNSSREFLDSLGFTEREEGDLGPVYGFQWRHFGAEYTDMHADYTGKGVDQLQQVIDAIKTNPSSRRIVMSAWNPCDLNKMALPPCHVLIQFYVMDGALSCHMYQRSADVGLGVPFNIASYSLLARMVAQVCGLKAKEFVYTIGDAHIYHNHIDALREQVKRIPSAFPQLHINSEKTDIDSFVYEDFTLEGYKPQKTIKMKMAV